MTCLITSIISFCAGVVVAFFLAMAYVERLRRKITQRAIDMVDEEIARRRHMT